MRIAIIGATGGVGRWLMAIARENGDHVKALVRDRKRLPDDLGAIGIVVGDVRDASDVAATVSGCDVVLSALGADGLGATDVYSKAATNLVAAMRDAKITRLSVLSSVGAEDDPNANVLFKRVLGPVMLRNVLADMREMENIVAASDLVWTIVRPSGLTDGPRTGLYRAEERFVPKGGSRISRADVADFMYRTIVDERVIRKITALAY